MTIGDQSVYDLVGKVTQMFTGESTEIHLEVKRVQDVQHAAGSLGRPGNVPAGATFTSENYCGTVTWLVGLLLFPCIGCCPLDSRRVYMYNEQRWDEFGAVLPNQVARQHDAYY